MPIDDKYVDYAVEYANKYFPQTVETGGWARVAGRDEAETAEILDYLRKKDFGDVNGRATISAILQDLVGGIEIPANPEAATRDVVYFSGANGSKDTLIKAANEGTLPEVKAVLDDPKIFNGNFARFKELFHKYQTMFTGPEG
jgi:hypothetical protein